MYACFPEGAQPCLFAVNTTLLSLEAAPFIRSHSASPLGEYEHNHRDQDISAPKLAMPLTQQAQDDLGGISNMR